MEQTLIAETVNRLGAIGIMALALAWAIRAVAPRLLDVWIKRVERETVMLDASIEAVKGIPAIAGEIKALAAAIEHRVTTEIRAAQTAVTEAVERRLSTLSGTVENAVESETLQRLERLERAATRAGSMPDSNSPAHPDAPITRRGRNGA